MIRRCPTPVALPPPSMATSAMDPNRGTAAPYESIGGGQVGEETWMGGTRGGGRLLVVLGNKMSDEKNENREGDGAMSFDGFCWLR